jgi:hypothetical protein
VLENISLGNTVLKEFQKIIYKSIMKDDWINAIYFSPACFEYTGYQNKSFDYSINYFFQSLSDDKIYSASSWYAHFSNGKLMGVSRT